MAIPTRNENITLFAEKFLAQLEIKAPAQKQVALMKSLLTDVGVILLEFSCARQLTPQETACLFWVARGKTIKQIGKILQVQHTTIKTYFQRIKQKLNCTTMEQAVFEGIRYCYLRPKWRKK